MDPKQRVAFLGQLEIVREFRTDGYAIRGVVAIHGSKSIKIEFVNEARIAFSPFERGLSRLTPLPTLSRVDLFAEKLLANEDRGLDEAFNSRDVIDLSFMVRRWGEIPPAAWDKVDQAYVVDDRFRERLERSKQLLANPYYLNHCLHVMSIDPGDGEGILDSLNVMPQELNGEQAAIAAQRFPSPWSKRH